jgi:hypothetical protein
MKRLTPHSTWWQRVPHRTQAQFPGYRLRLVSGIETHNGYVRFSWAAARIAGSSSASRRDRFRRHRGGRPGGGGSLQPGLEWRLPDHSRPCPRRPSASPAFHQTYFAVGYRGRCLCLRAAAAPSHVTQARHLIVRKEAT